MKLCTEWVTDHDLKERLNVIEKSLECQKDLEKIEDKKREEHYKRCLNISEKARIPTIITDCIFDHWEKTQTYDDVYQALKNMKINPFQRHMMFVYGLGGTGKTIASCKVLIDLISSEENKYWCGKFIRAIDFISLEKKNKLAKDLYETDILILDDIGQEQQDQRFKIEDIIIDRQNWKRLTLLTSNFALHELPYDDRCIDLIIQGAQFVPCWEVVRPGVRDVKQFPLL